MSEIVRRNMRATMKDVAKASGVSTMTVSNVLNGRSEYVSAATKKKVEREIERLGYRRQANARNLRVSQQRSVGMVIVDQAPTFLATLFTAHVVAGLANVLNGADYTLSVQGIRPGGMASSMIMRNFDVGGFCLMASGTPAYRKETARTLVGLDQPMIIFQEDFTGLGDDLCIVRQDDRGGGRLIGDHLLARRARRLLMVIPQQPWPAMENRIEGVRDSIEGSGVDVEFTVIECKTEAFGDAQHAVAQYLATHQTPDAVIGGNDAIATAALLLLLDRGFKVPQEIRVIGFNGFAAHRYSRPRLTTILSASYAIGETAGHAMLSRLKGAAFECTEYVLPVQFDLGETT
jgi:DNA-binding LacI/PurR family transcriptional regulator